MYGCWDNYYVFRTVDKAVSNSIAATAAGVSRGSPSSTSGSKSSSNSKSTTGGGSHGGIIAAVVAAIVVVLLIIAVLVAYIIRLRSRSAQYAPATELQKVPSDPSAPGSAWGVPGAAAKPELSTSANAWEMGGREIHQIPPNGGAPAAGLAGRHAYDPAAGSVRYPGGQAPAPRTPEGQHPYADAPAQPHSFLEMEGSGAAPRWERGAELPG
jgi:hypothetical protein